MPYAVNPKDVFIQLNKNEFELDTQKEHNSWEQLRLLVANKVAELMELNPGEFFNMLYIMDVNEDKINKAIHEADAPYFAVADIVIERETEKVISRKQYANYFDDVESEAEPW